VRRTPRLTAQPRSGPRIGVATTSVVNPQSQTPIFALQHMQSPYCVDNLSAKQKALFAEAMWRHSHVTWLEITVAPKHGLGQEDIPRRKIRGKIPKHVTEDVDFIALRCFGKAPMVGYRDGRIFHVLWLDHDFSLYDHGS
jgi:hypothetical protein